MAEAQTEKKGAKKSADKKPEYARRTLRKMGRDKRREKLLNDSEALKAFNERKSKNSAARKVAFRKRHAKS